MSYVLVWDIETVPDLEGFARAHGYKGKSENEIIELIGDGFPKHPFHSIICIGAIVGERRDGVWHTKAIGAPHIGDRSEHDLIKSFLARIDEISPQLVTYNGSSFDLPVLRYRAMIHHLSARGLFRRSYFNRFTEDALDLCDVLSSYGAATPKMKLDELCKLMGLEGKPDTIDGSRVADFYRQGRIKEISDYCVSDVINTYRLWLRYQLFKGELTHDEFKRSEDNLSQTRTKLDI